MSRHLSSVASRVGLGLALVVVTAAACTSGAGATGAGGAKGGAGQSAGAAGQAGAGEVGSAAGPAGSNGGAAGVADASGAAGNSAAGASGAAGSDAGAGTAGAPDGGASDDGGVSDGPAAAGCDAAGALCWDFEQGTLPPGWTPYRNEYNGTLLVDGTRPLHGKYSLHAKGLQGNVEGSDGGPKKTMRYTLPATFGPTLWGRAFVYVSPARPMSHAGFFNARYPRPGAKAADFANVSVLDWYEVASSAMDYVSIYHPPEPPGTPEWVQVSTTPLVLNDWVCVEWLFDAKNGDAAEAADPRVWVAGAEIPWSMTFVSPTGATRPAHEKATTFSVLEAGVYLYQGLSAATDWWIDDLAVSPQRVGCD
jgi:hypothetical protein